MFNETITNHQTSTKKVNYSFCPTFDLNEFKTDINILLGK